ncbi:TPA: hypothetical protein M2Q89_004861 [Escherichia coli]|nr:hypothetical protein [Escherichia coli]
MFALINRGKENGLSLIEVSLSILISGLVILFIQLAISNIIKKAVHENSLHDISFVMHYVQDELQSSCYGKSQFECDKQISSIMSELNMSDKIKIQIDRSNNVLSVYVLYSLAKNEDFGSLSLTHASAYTGTVKDNVVSSILGWWKVNAADTIFSGKNADDHLFFYNNFMVKTYD